MDDHTNLAGVIWISGYSSSGKTTVGRKVENRLRRSGLRTVFFDGDDLRSIFSNRWGYERAERIELAKIYFRLCSHLAAQGFTIIIAAVAMYDEVRQWLRKNVPASVEIYLDVPVSERIRRDELTKGVYAKNTFGNNLYDESQSADLVVQNHGRIDPDGAAAAICEFFLTKGVGRTTDRGKDRHWDAYYKSNLAPSKPSTFAQFVAEDFGESERRILEVGCGNGRDAAFFHECGYEVTAIDSSLSAIEYCRKLYAETGIQFIVAKADTGLTLDDEQYDAIYSRFCLHAMTPTEESKFLKYATAKLVDGGHLFIECRSINDRLASKGEVLSPTERIHGHYRRFIVKDELVARLEALGLSIRKKQESAGLAVHGDDDPVVIRIIARKVG